MGSVRWALLACALVVGAQALLPEDLPTAVPAARGAKSSSGAAEGDAWGSAAGPPGARKGSDRYLGRLEKEPGYGSYLCYNKYMFDDVPADSSDIKRLVLAAPEVVPSAGAAPTSSEIADWVAKKFAVPTAQLSPEVLSAALASNDWVDSKGIRHVRLSQRSDSLDMGVDYGSVIVHMAANKAILVTGGIIPDLEAKTSKDVSAASGFISPSDASAAAIRAALGTLKDAPKALQDRLKAAAANPNAKTLEAASVSTPDRVLHCTKDGTCKPTFKQVVFLPKTRNNSPKELHVYVSANDGKVLYMANRLRTAGRELAGNPKRKGDDVLWVSLGRGKSLYAGEVPISTAASGKKAKGGPYQLNDITQNSMTYDMLNKDDDYFYANPKDTLFRDKDNVWGDYSTKSRQSAAVDAHWGATTTLFYYKDAHGRLGVDGRAGALQSRVHTSEGFDNAYWYNNMMTYGDGSRDPKQWNKSCEGFPPLTALDIIAHELTHGVTEYSAGLIYQQSMGGINEAMSDIMSQCVVDYAHETQGYPRKPDFKLGSQLFPSDCARGFLRSMIDPTADNARSSGCWHNKFDRMFNETHGDVEMLCYVDVHWSSGVANRAFWLLSKGLNQTCDKTVKPQAIGVSDSCNIFYRALTGYLSKVADYHELRLATRQAAIDLFGANSPKIAAVAQAWDIVGAPSAPYPNSAAPKCQATFATTDECTKALLK